ncbi:LysR family transcriptional regulator [Robertmurraya massiliosenegalensis]|uniref:LysR substrate-binding domain-containing protein n=1 Tax=Robertmurraya TaxID=2837507 RepID=UPI0039A4CAE9
MIERLIAFLEVVKTRNISKAAENLFTSQPSISMKIKSLETDFNTKLFHRTKKYMLLTDEGEHFHNYAESMVGLYKQAMVTIGEFKDLERGTLSVSSGAFYGIYLLPELLGIYKERFPKIEINIEIVFSEVVVQGVLNNKFELGFIGELNEAKNHTDLVCNSFYNDELILVFSPKNKRLSSMKEVQLEELLTEMFIISDHTSAMRQLVEKEFYKNGLNLRSMITLSNIESIKNTVINNLGISILSKLSVKKEIEQGILKTIPIKDQVFSRKLFYIYRNDKTLSNSANEFLKLCLEYFS